MPSANIDMVSQAYDAYTRGAAAEVFQLLDPEIEIIQTTDLPWGGHYRGLMEAITFFGKLREHVEALPQPETLFEAGNDVVAVGRLRGRARSSGAAIDLPIVHIWTFRDGRIIRFSAFIDTPAMLAALNG
jgi:ketosteroid isomerase-like protein